MRTQIPDVDQHARSVRKRHQRDAGAVVFTVDSAGVELLRLATVRPRVQVT